MSERLLRREPLAFLALSVLIVFSSHALPGWVTWVAKKNQWAVYGHLGDANFYSLTALLFSVLLVFHDPVGYGVRLGQLKERWPWILAICVVPIVLTAIVYPQLPNKPFSGGPIEIWLISPLAQDLLFAGYFYRRFTDHFPGSIHRLVPAEKAILITAFYFALWHVPNFVYGIGAYGWFQLLYTFAGASLLGLVRQWSGSLIYITVVHMVVNCIAVHT